MININLLKINSSQNEINVEVSTSIGNKFTKIYLWENNNYKDYAKAIDVSNLIQGTSNVEVISIPSSVLDREFFTGIYILEFTTDENNDNIKEGVVANLIQYFECLINKTLKLNIKNCKIEYNSDCDDCDAKSLLMINTLINSIKISLQLGYYREAITIMYKLDSICGTCSECDEITDNIFTGQDSVSILNNIIII